MSDFFREVFSLWAKAVNNFYPDNFDWEIRRLGVYRRAIILFERRARAAIRSVGRNKPGVLIVSRQNYFLQNIEKFEHTYELLTDGDSRKKFIELLVYKMLGFTKVKLSLKYAN
jgi:hypothetical protein